MVDKLKEIFISYINVVQLRIENSHSEELMSLIDQLEKSNEFCQLVEKTHSELSSDGYHGKDKSSWELAVNNFFRRSMCYIDIYKQNFPNKELLLAKYIESFQRQQTKIRYLAPIEFVSFSKECIDFGVFQIRKYSREELDLIFQNKINKIFNHWATINVEEIKDYWFISVEELVPTKKIGYIYWEQNPLKIKYTPYPKVVESVLKQLSIFNWEPDWLKDGYLEKYPQEDYPVGFSIPFVLRINDNLLEYPENNRPDFSRLAKESRIDSLTDEEIGSYPMITTDLDEKQTTDFESCIHDIIKSLSNIEINQSNWHFIDIALGFSTKAFLSEGIERLLWYVTTLESLLGEKGSGLTAKLAKRVATILGKDESENKSIRKEFEELYEFRCNLVHGRPFKKQILATHIIKVQNMVRQIILFFLYFLNTITDRYSSDFPCDKIPTREDILAFLDMDKSRRTSIVQLVNIFLKETIPMKK
ncbi:MAG: hypothetical protein WC955_00060 [Elusimicrobiota bacterium]